MKRTVFLIYPFSPEAIGLTDATIIGVHENEIIRSLQKLSRSERWRCSVHYLTDARPASYTSKHGGLEYIFHKTSFRVSWANYSTETLDHFGDEWSFHLVRSLLLKSPSVAIFFMSVGWFTKLLALLFRTLRIPYIIIVAGWGIPRGRSQRWFFKQAEQVLVHTERHKKWLHQERGIPLDNMEVFPVGINTSLFQEKTRVDDFPKRPPRLLYVGRLVPGKGLHQAVATFAECKKKFPRATMTVIGAWGDEGYRQEVQSLIRESHLSKAVSFTGSLPNKELPGYYQAADILLLPSKSESFGIVLVEAMACGTVPVAIQDSGGPDEIITHGETGLLVDSTNIDQAVIDLLNDRPRLVSMGIAARKEVEERFSSQATFQKLSEMLKLATQG